MQVYERLKGSSVTLSAILSFARKSLEAAGVRNPQVNAETMVSHVLGLKRAQLYLEPERPVGASDEARIIDSIKLRERRLPLQYVIGEWEFMSLQFKVREGVFIPRPETEVLVETLVREARRRERAHLKILDLGTGSGAIAVSLAKYLQQAWVVACDISPVALEVARENAILNGVEDRIVFIAGEDLDFLDRPRAGEKWSFDLVACNPPYIETGAIESSDPEVRDHEPRIAIDGGQDGLSFVRRILPQIPSVLCGGGVVGFEIGASQADPVRKLFREVGLRDVEVIKDLAERDRVVIGMR